MNDNSEPSELPDLLLDNVKQHKFLEKRKFIQSNKLIESIFEQKFKELELKTIALISKYINENKFIKTNNNHSFQIEKTMGGFLRIDIKKQEFCNFLHIDPSNFYRDMKCLTKDLLKKSILIESIEEKPIQNKKSFSIKKRFIGITLFSAIACDEGQAIFCINPALQIYLQHLKSNFTVLSLEHISKMNSAHAIKIYQLIKQYETIGHRTIKLEELKKMLGISNTYLGSFTDFKRDVLQIAAKNINKICDINIDYTFTKKGNKVEEIIFKITSKQIQIQQAIKQFKKEVKECLLLNNLSLKKQHEQFISHWQKTEGDIEKNQHLFESWIVERIADYKPQSTEKIKLKPLEEIFSTPKWYDYHLQSLIFQKNL